MDVTYLTVAIKLRMGVEVRKLNFQVTLHLVG